MERELTLSEIAALPEVDRLQAIRHRIATKDYETRQIEDDRYFESLPDRLLIHLKLTDEEIGFLYQLLDEKERQCRAIIKRNADYPTYNSKALRSDQKQQDIIARIEYIRAAITDQ